MTIEVLIIDPEPDAWDDVTRELASEGFVFTQATSAKEGLQAVSQRDFDAVVSELTLPDEPGLDAAGEIISQRPDTPVIIATQTANLEGAVAALRTGTHDFLAKPVLPRALAHAIRRSSEHRRLRDEVQRLSEEVRKARPVGRLIGQSPAMERVYDLIRRVADTEASVLITGESGTGKELVARALHEEGGRRREPFIAINCAAIPENLLESELFGHARGAFTGAREGRRGLFEQAGRGTIFLDEIGDMRPEMQAKLLRVLQEMRVRPVGGTQTIPLRARVLAATNIDLEVAVREGTFREDLYYRLNVVQIHVPPLRAREDDVLLLAKQFTLESARKNGKDVTGFSPEAARLLLNYDWPGNVRQLQNWMERAVTLTRFSEIGPGDIPDKVRNHQSAPSEPAPKKPELLPTLSEMEDRYIDQVLRAVGGNKSQAAKILGLNRKTLYRRLEKRTPPRAP